MEERKARLRALAAKAGRLRAKPTMEETAEPVEEIDPPPSQDRDTTSEPALKKSKTDTSSAVLEKALEKAQQVECLSDAATTTTKKVDWDLKRDIQPKLDKLEKRYQRALIKLLKKRLESEAENEGEN